MNDMQIDWMSVDELKPYANNAKEHPAEQIEQIKKSIKEFGFRDPIAIWHNNEIIEGHGRLMAAIELKIQKVPVIHLDDMTDEQRRAYMLVHNKLTMNSDFNPDLLAIELDDIFDVDMGDFGFDDVLGSVPEPSEIVDEDVPDVPKKAKTKEGDIYILGEHRLICGDATDSVAVTKLMDGVLADICFTSPPYNAGALNIAGNKTTEDKYNKYDDDLTDDEYFDFLRNNMALMLSVCKEVFYNIGLVQGSKKAIIRLQNEFIDQFKDIIYWEKSTVAPHIQAGVINNLVEFILCFGNGQRKFENAQFSQGTYWNVIKGNNANQNEYSDIHKATFPVYLPVNIITNFCPPNGTVLDCFGGTGTTMIACEQLGRRCYMVELDPVYCDVIVERWENFTGQKAVRIKAGA